MRTVLAATSMRRRGAAKGKTRVVERVSSLGASSRGLASEAQQANGVMDNHGEPNSGSGASINLPRGSPYRGRRRSIAGHMVHITSGSDVSSSIPGSFLTHSSTSGGVIGSPTVASMLFPSASPRYLDRMDRLSGGTSGGGRSGVLRARLASGQSIGNGDGVETPGLEAPSEISPAAQQAALEKLASETNITRATMPKLSMASITEGEDELMSTRVSELEAGGARGVHRTVGHHRVRSQGSEQDARSSRASGIPMTTSTGGRSHSRS